MIISYVSKNDRWIIDSDCSRPMTSDISKFEKLEHYNGSSVKFSNDAPCYVKAKGSIILNDKIRCTTMHIGLMV